MKVGQGKVVLQSVKLELEFSNTCIKRYCFSAEIHRDLLNFPQDLCFSCLLLPDLDNALQVLRFDIVCNCFCAQALAKALKVNKTVLHIDLRENKIDNEGAERPDA